MIYIANNAIFSQGAVKSKIKPAPLVATILACLIGSQAQAVEKLQIVSVSATNEQTPNVASNALDGKFSTRWSSDQSGASATYDLGATKTIGSVKIAWYKGNMRRTIFTVQASTTGSNWQTLLNRSRSSGSTAGFESYDFEDLNARYIRLIGYGNDDPSASTALWTSVSETEVHSADTQNTPPADINNPIWKGVSLALTSTAENSTTDWTSAYGYIEDIEDGRGYTAGIVGFCSGTGDMLTLIQRANASQPNNILSKYIPKLEQIMAAPYSKRPALSHSLLGSAFIRDWKTASGTTWFRQAQRNERDRVYWNPALAAAQNDHLSPLGLALYYDISVNHGPGNDRESFGGILATAKRSVRPPAQGGNEAAYLSAVTKVRDTILKEWGDYQSEGRSTIFLYLLSHNPTLKLPLTWFVYGERFTLIAYPTP